MKYIKYISIILIPIIIIFILLNKNDKNIEENLFMSNYDYNLFIIEMDNKTLTLAPLNYDGDAKKEFVDKIFQVNIDEKIKFYSYEQLTINGYTTYNYKEIKTSDAKEEINNNGVTAYIYLNNKKEVTKVIFYGETILER